MTVEPKETIKGNGRVLSTPKFAISILGMIAGVGTAVEPLSHLPFHEDAGAFPGLRVIIGVVIGGYSTWRLQRLPRELAPEQYIDDENTATAPDPVTPENSGTFGKARAQQVGFLKLGIGYLATLTREANPEELDAQLGSLEDSIKAIRISCDIVGGNQQAQILEPGRGI